MMEANAPPAIKTKKTVSSRRAAKALENQWAGLTGGSYGMHTPHVWSSPPAFRSEEAKVPPPAGARRIAGEGVAVADRRQSSHKKMPHVSPKERDPRRRPRSSNKTAPPCLRGRQDRRRPARGLRPQGPIVAWPGPARWSDRLLHAARVQPPEEIEGESLGLSLVDGRLMYESATKDEETEGMKSGMAVAVRRTRVAGRPPPVRCI